MFPPSSQSTFEAAAAPPPAGDSAGAPGYVSQRATCWGDHSKVGPAG